MVLLKKYSKKNYSNKIYGYGFGHPTKKTGFIKVDDRPFMNKSVNIHM